MRALVRRPSPLLADGLVTHIDRSPVDAARALDQWGAYVDALRGADWEIVEVEAADGCPDGVFVEDAAVMFGDLCVLTRPGAPERVGEVETVAETMRALDVRTEQLPEGTLDGGDVLKVGRRVHVGLSGRTDATGIAALARLVGPEGFEVVAVPTTKVLHLKSAVTALPDGTVIGYDDLVDDPSVFESYRSMPEPDGAHVVLLGEDRLLVSASAPRSAERLAAMGYDPVTVDIAEFEKLEGCVTCLSIRIRA
ncbi:MAG: dimethylargininase [Actinomycetota bacterium]